ncbi:MAG TPA: stalk domain-containing protein [Fimbriimonas sp.]|nr:stalk domain-containing protein [Fimbriimonas sp.]
MLISNKVIRRLFIAGLSAIAASASATALTFDQQISINKAIDSPTITVRYAGVTAALVEIQVNGESLGTRTVSSTKDSGETNFTLNLTDLKEGDNKVVIRLFDRTGKLVGQEHTTLTTEAVQHGPVFLASPKTGATVRGPVELRVGFERPLRDTYVTFFIDGRFKSMRNYAPFTYLWDTEKESQGWHELEAWAIDDSSTTLKTGKIRVFVENNGGQTDRRGSEIFEISPNAKPDIKMSADKGVKKLAVKASPKHVEPKMSAGPLPSVTPNKSVDVLGSPSGRKPMAPASSIAMGPQSMVPTGTRNALTAKPHAHAQGTIEVARHSTSVKHTSSVVSQVTAAATLMDITYGSRIPNIGAFTVALDSNFVDFHGVLPRVDDGVPMTPLRFLLEKKGGLVDWETYSKTVTAKADGNSLSLHIGDPFALINNANVSLDRPSYLDRGRTIVPLSFIRSALKVDVQYDKQTGHVLIMSAKK